MFAWMCKNLCVQVTTVFSSTEVHSFIDIHIENEGQQVVAGQKLKGIAKVCFFM